LSFEQYIPVFETMCTIAFLSTIFELYSEIALSRKPLGIRHMHIYIFLLRRTNTITSQNIDPPGAPVEDRINTET
jgi:hypothetical protein